MKEFAIYLGVLLFALIIISIILARLIYKNKITKNTKNIFSKSQYNIWCKKRDEVLNNIPITFDSHCNVDNELDIYSLYDKNIEDGFKQLKIEKFSISQVGRI